MAVNVVVLVGRLTADPELRSTQSGISVCGFTVAVERRYSTDGERQTDFIRCVAWRKAAEFVAKYFNKGKMIGVEGSIQTRNYEDNYGNRRTAVEIMVDNVAFVGGKAENGGGSNSAPAQAGPGNVDGFEEITSDEDLPF